MGTNAHQRGLEGSLSGLRKSVDALTRDVHTVRQAVSAVQERVRQILFIQILVFALVAINLGLTIIKG